MIPKLTLEGACANLELFELSNSIVFLILFFKVSIELIKSLLIPSRLFVTGWLFLLEIRG